MPIYEYTCQSCQSEFELLVGPSAGKPSCPGCGSKKVQKKFSTFAAHQPSAAVPACAEGACPGGGQPLRLRRRQMPLRVSGRNLKPPALPGDNSGHPLAVRGA